MSPNAKIALGACLGCAATLGWLLYGKVSTLDTKGIEEEMQKYITKKTEEQAKKHLASNYGITEDRITRIGNLASRFGA